MAYERPRYKPGYGLWRGKITKELDDLHRQYNKMFNGFDACGYEEIGDTYDDFTYEQYVAYIKESLKQGIELPLIVDPNIYDDYDYDDDDDDYDYNDDNDDDDDDYDYNDDDDDDYEVVKPRKIHRDTNL